MQLRHIAVKGDVIQAVCVGAVDPPLEEVRHRRDTPAPLERIRFGHPGRPLKSPGILHSLGGSVVDDAAGIDQAVGLIVRQVVLAVDGLKTGLRGLLLRVEKIVEPLHQTGKRIDAICGHVHQGGPVLQKKTGCRLKRFSQLGHGFIHGLLGSVGGDDVLVVLHPRLPGGL